MDDKKKQLASLVMKALYMDDKKNFIQYSLIKDEVRSRFGSIGEQKISID